MQVRYALDTNRDFVSRGSRIQWFKLAMFVDLRAVIVRQHTQLPVIQRYALDILPVVASMKHCIE